MLHCTKSHSSKKRGRVGTRFADSSSEDEEYEQTESKKRGKRSNAQKPMRARGGNAPVPPANPVEGSSRKHGPDYGSGVELSVRTTEKKMRETKAK
ncbi:MAG: hypothetical protein C5B55_12820 [Blastocatellia bacterium]|nr:MAG: hypothetical protein C5B55_12820 [Blastocatellia bacterium]